jgi:UDP-N-acetylglucosamine--N-acetylmuramyl-(pentapeptide) pyrophosphoryl-undecaprenol N-acetylglucosamine transferase
MIRALPELMKRVPGLHVIHQTGERDYNQVQAAYAQASIQAEVHKFIDDMPGLFARADLVLCRSGASTVAEIAAAGKPAIFVPFPLAADDHQRRNAEAMEQAQAAVVLEETRLDEVWLVDTICALLEDPGRLVRMSDAARAMAHPNAARDIAELAAKVAGIEEAGSRL